MPFQDIVGHERPIQILKGALRRGCLAHAYLFSGEEGIGKLRVARALAQTANCLASGTSPGEEACGQCLSCRTFEAGTHPDWVYIQPEGTMIKIGQVRELGQKISLSPISARYRFVIFHHAESMNQEAANALLKGLEEPPRHTVMILITSRPHALLKTVVSRCQGIRFASLSPQQLAALLRKKYPGDHQEPSAMSALAVGRIGPALFWDPAELEQQWHQFQRVLSPDFSRKPESTMGDLMDLAQEYGRDRKSTEQALQWTGLWLNCLLWVKLNASAAHAGGGPPELARIASRLQVEDIFSLAKLIQWIWTALNRNINRPLALETLLLQIRRTLNPR